jgi:hypothetical protein
MKLEVRDSSGKLLATLPTSKRRGLSRVPWSMTMPPPRIPPAASVAFGVGPRFLPGKYTVKLIDGDNEYTAPLRVIRDPRATHTPADRKAQYDLALRLYGMLGEMTSLVDQMNGVRGELEARAAAMTATDTAAVKLRAASETVDQLRKKIVATKEGGMITGEERLRENLTNLYGAVNGYEGRPSATQVNRTTAIAREMADVKKEFDAWIATRLGAINTMLAARNAPKIEVPVP